MKLCHAIGISQSTHLWMTGIFTFLLLFLTGSKAEAQSDLTFNEGIRYSQWVIDSRMNDFWANTTKCGFAVYDRTGEQTAGREDGKTSLDYVVGLVAKSIIEASQYYSQFPWAQSFAKPWFLSIQDYGDNFYDKFRTVGGSLDDLNAVKLFVPLREMTSTNGVYPNTTTYDNTKTALDKAIEGLQKHNESYSIKSGTLAETGGKYNVLGGWWHKADYKDQMWLDGAYMGPALFAQLVNYSGKTTNIDSSNDWDLIVKQFEILHSLCWDSDDKLPYHAFAADGGTNSTSHSDTWAGLKSTSPYVFHSASYWGRAAGWYFLALVDILEEMDKAKISASDTKYIKLKGYLTEIAQGLAKRQDQATGGWYQILDQKDTYSASEYNDGKSHTATKNYIESSATALFTAAYLKAIRRKYISETETVTVNGTAKTYKDIAVNGYQCLVNNFFSLDSYGKVNIFGSCRSAGLGGSGDKYMSGAERFRDGSKAYYLLGYDVARVAKSENKTEGKVLGAFILAATEYERQYQNTTLLAKDLNPSYTIKSGESIPVELLGDGTATYKWYDANTSTAVSEAASFAPTTSGKYYCKITVTPPATSAQTRAASTGTYEITTRTTDVKVEGTSTGGGSGNESTPSNIIYKYTVSTSENAVNNAYTATGGTATLGAAKVDDKNGLGFKSDGGIGSSKYIKVDLTNNTLQAGDVITIKAYSTNSGGGIYIATATAENSKYVSAGTLASKNTAEYLTYTVTESDVLNGLSTIYLFRNGTTSGSGTSTYIQEITITRSGSSTEPSKSNDASATFKYNGNNLNFTGDVATINLESTKAGSNITINATPAAGATISPSSANTSITNNVISITAPAAGSNASYTYTVTAEDGTTTKEYTINVNVAAPVLYTVTLDAGTNGTCSTTYITQKSEGEAINLPNATPNSGYTFDGWYTAAEGGDKVNSTYTPNNNITLYAHYTTTSTGSTTELFSLTNVTSETVKLAATSTQTLTASHATITGGSAEVYNNRSEEVAIITGSKITLGGSGSSYLHIALSEGETLQVGDVITFEPSDATSFYISNTKDKKSKISTTSNSYTITEGDILVGKNEIYIFKNSSSSISSVTITRIEGIIINNQPTNAAFDINAETGSISITASASDNSVCAYQWYKCDDSSGKNAQLINGATSASYSPDKSTVGTYYYYCVVSAGSWTPVTSNIVKVTINKIKLILEYSDTDGKTEWTWNSTTTPEKPAFTSPTVKAYKTDAKGNRSDLLTDKTLSYEYEIDVPDVATVTDEGVISLKANANGGAKVYASLNEHAIYYADPAAFDILIEQGYSFSVGASETAPAINTSRYITRKISGEGGEVTENLVKMTFGGWKWNGYASANAPEKTLGSYNVDRAGKITYYTDKWNDSSTKASDIASIDGHYYWWSGQNDAVDESKAASKNEYGNEVQIYGSVRYGWFKSPEHDSDGKTTTSYPFSLPVRGSYMTFEPYMNGTLTIYILQNGAWNTNDNGGTYESTDGNITYEKGDIIPGVFRPHAFQVVNQRGLTVQEFSPKYSVSTKQKVDSRYYCMFPNDEDYNEAKYNNPYNVAKWTEFADYMSDAEQQRAHDKWNSGPLGAQEIIELDNGSFLAVQKGIVKYTFHVTGNETYYFFSNFSKMGFSGANFVPDKAQPEETVSGKISTLELSDETKYEQITATPNGTIEGSNLIKYTYKIGDKDIASVAGVSIPQFYSIKLNRTFKPGQWTTLCLPFNLTQEEVQRIFGKGTQIIMLDKATLNNGGARLHFIYHEIQNVLPGYPYLIWPTLAEVEETNDAIADVNISGDSETGNGVLTSFTVYSKCINPFINRFEVNTDPYIFMGTPGYCTADVEKPGSTTKYSVKYPANDIFISEGDGKLYVSEDKSYGKGYRAWLQKKKDGTTAVKSISVVIGSFSDDDNTTTAIDVAEMAPDLLEALGIQTGVYNLNGQRVANDTRNLKAGIYIVNGKKTVVR